MKTILLKILLLLLMVFGQSCTTNINSSMYDKYNEQDYVYWSDSRKLTWTDFEGKPEPGKEKFKSEVFIYNPSTIEKSNLLSKPALTSFIVFDKKKSWCQKENRNDQHLLYNQVIFDIYELYTRKLRERFSMTEFSTDDYKKEFQKMTEENNKALKIKIAQYQKETNLGDDFDETIRWNKKIISELNQLEDFKEQKN